MMAMQRKELMIKALIYKFGIFYDETHYFLYILCIFSDFYVASDGKRVFLKNLSTLEDCHSDTEVQFRFNCPSN